MTSSIRIAQVFPELVGKKTRAIWKVYEGMLKHILNKGLYLAHYDEYFHINDDAKKCKYLSVQITLYSFFHNSFKLLSHERCMAMLGHGYTNKKYLFLKLV